SIDYLTANIMLPLGALFIALFAGYVLPKATVMSQLGITSKFAIAIWTTSTRVLAPLGVLIVFLYTILPID
ncbi:MAG: sodium-dependent transporter, partial [Pseudomonadota bacterium]|nr:sodium-dependent transporter [Pseudomonadota bacterium]